MSDLYEDDEEELLEVVEDFDDVEIDPEFAEIPAVSGGMDARRRLEKMLEEKRLRDELEDFVDF